MAMTEQRRMEIALKIVEEMVMDRGFPGGSEIKRGIGNQATKIGVPTEELMAFYETFLPAIIKKTFGYKNVEIAVKR